MRRDTAIVVRALVVDAESRPSPAVPVGWDVIVEAGGWCTLYPLGREARPDAWIHALLVARDGSNGAWVILGPRAIVDRIVAVAARSWTDLAALRADGGAVATRLKAAWEGGVGTTVRARMASFLDDDGEP